MVLFGDFAIEASDIEDKLIAALLKAPNSVSFGSFGVLDDAKQPEETLGAQQLCRILVPIHSVYEKSGVMVNKDSHIQRVRQVLPALDSSFSLGELLQGIAKRAGKSLFSADPKSSRLVFKEMVKEISELSGLTLKAIGDLGLSIDDKPISGGTSSSVEERV